MFSKAIHRHIRIAAISIGMIFMLTLSGCHNKTSPLLEKADRLMRENPDSALSIMEAFNPRNLSDDREKAFHALLLTEARYMTGTDQTDDSIINIATTYYHLRDNDPLRARAYYQKGMIHNNSGQYSSAMLSLMLAEETAAANNDIRLLALIHRSMADTFCSMNNPRTAVSYYTKSYDEFCLANDSVYVNDALYDIAKAHHNATNYQEAVDVLKKLLPKVESSGNRQLIPYILDVMGTSCQFMGNDSEAISVLTRLHDEYPSEMKPSNWNDLGLAYLRSGNLGKAEECEDSIKALTAEPSWLSYRIADTKGDFGKALTLLKKEYHDGDMFFIDWVSRSAEKDLLDQYAALKESAMRERRDSAVILTLVVVILMLVAVIAYMVIKKLRSRNRKLTDHNARLAEDNMSLTDQRECLTGQLNANAAVIRNLRENIGRQNNEIISLRADLHTLMEKGEELAKEIEAKTEQNGLLMTRMEEAGALLASREEAVAEARKKLREAVASQSDLIDGMVKAYYNSRTTPLPKNEVLDKFSEILLGLKHDNDLIRQFEKTVNRHLDNLMVHFREDYPDLNAFEYDLFLLIVLGFSPKSISVLQNINVDNFYNRKSKLVKKIKSGSLLPRREKYMDFIM